MGESFPTVPTVINAGVSGESTRDMVPRLQRLLQSKPGRHEEIEARLFDESPDVVLILGGTNDLSRMTPNRILENVLKLHEIAHGTGAITGVLTIPQCFSSFASKQEPFREVREQVNEGLHSFVRQSKGRAFLVDMAIHFPQDE